MPSRIAALVACLAFAGPAAAEWRTDFIDTPGPVTAIEADAAGLRIAVGQDWYSLAADTARMQPAKPPPGPPLPANALPDGRLAMGQTTIARAWFAAPTARYRHGVLGDAIEAGSLAIERHDGRNGIVTLSANAVFEDLWPRIVKLDGIERIVAIKSYLNSGSAVAIIDANAMAIIAETPPIGRPNAWMNPAGIADYDGDGTVDIAVVRQPHVVGRLELWSWRRQALKKIAEVTDVSNHVIGSRALGMSWTSDFDGDGHPDLAVPSLDRRTLRLIAFTPHVRDIARIAIPARATSNIGSTMFNGRPALVMALEDGRLIIVHD